MGTHSKSLFFCLWSSIHLQTHPLSIFHFFCSFGAIKVGVFGIDWDRGSKWRGLQHLLVHHPLPLLGLKFIIPLKKEGLSIQGGIIWSHKNASRTKPPLVAEEALSIEELQGLIWVTVFSILFCIIIILLNGVSLAFACYLIIVLWSIGIGGQGGLKLTYGIRALGTTFRARRVDKVILFSEVIKLMQKKRGENERENQGDLLPFVYYFCCVFF